MPVLLCNKLEQFKISIDELEKSLTVPTNRFNFIATKTIKYGQIKLFEICTRHLWEAIKDFITVSTGAKSKTISKALDKYSKSDLCNEALYDKLVSLYDMTEDFSLINDEEQLKLRHNYVVTNRDLFFRVYESIRIMLY